MVEILRCTQLSELIKGVGMFKRIAQSVMVTVVEFCLRQRHSHSNEAAYLMHELR